MTRQTFFILLALVLLLAGAGFLVAQATPSASIDWWVAAGGGDSASAENILLDATVGQPFVGEAAGGEVSLGAGYWYAQALVDLYLPVVFKP